MKITYRVEDATQTQSSLREQLVEKQREVDQARTTRREFQRLAKEKHKKDAATIASLRAERDKLKAELAEAWREAYCCEDIKLDQPLAGIISEMQQDRERLAVERDDARGLLNAPELLSFRDGVVLEAAHQRKRWDSEHDAGKMPADWFWLVGYLAGKALSAAASGNRDKALHHTISTAAALANWHAAILGKTDMRPGLSAEKQDAIDAAKGAQ